MRMGWLLSVVITLCLISPAMADWTYYGNYTGTVETGLFIGADTVRTFTDEDHQPVQISGAGTALPTGGSLYQVDFHFAGNTWDAYVPKVDEGTGYYDVFSLVLTEKSKGYYWDLANTSIHPLTDNPDLVTANQIYSNDLPWWGGHNARDNILETDDSNVTLFFDTDPNKEYYMTFFLQTLGDEDHPSWGTVSNIQAKIVPEPTACVLFLLGAGALVGRLRLRRKA